MTDVALNKAIKKIKSWVDSHTNSRNIFIRGHADETGDDNYNYILSYRRALFVANIIKEHLNAKNLKQGVDYHLNIEGLGESRPVAKKAGENQNEWWARCRRIELAFQKISAK